MGWALSDGKTHPSWMRWWVGLARREVARLPRAADRVVRQGHSRRRPRRDCTDSEEGHAPAWPLLIFGNGKSGAAARHPPEKQTQRRERRRSAAPSRTPALSVATGHYSPQRALHTFARTGMARPGFYTLVQLPGVLRTRP